MVFRETSEEARRAPQLNPVGRTLVTGSPAVNYDCGAWSFGADKRTTVTIAVTNKPSEKDLRGGSGGRSIYARFLYPLLLPDTHPPPCSKCAKGDGEGDPDRDSSIPV